MRTCPCCGKADGQFVVTRKSVEDDGDGDTYVCVHCDYECAAEQMASCPVQSFSDGDFELVESVN